MDPRSEKSTPIAVIDPVRFVFERREVLRLLGYGPRDRAPNPRVEKRIDETIREAATLLAPRGTWVIHTLREAPESGPFRGAEQIGYGVVTIGRQLQEQVSKLSRQGEPLRALILDAIGSACVESVADVVNAAICEEVEQREVFTNRRISPGYRSWPIEGQLEIFGALPTRVTGVSLGPRYFMDPRKSVSFAVGIGRHVQHSKYVSICAYCNLPNCKFRRFPEAPPN